MPLTLTSASSTFGTATVQGNTIHIFRNEVELEPDPNEEPEGEPEPDAPSDAGSDEPEDEPESEK